MDRKKQKILIVISGNLFVRNYILSKAFEDLENKYDCYYIVNKDVTNPLPIEEKVNFLGFYEIEKLTRKLNQRLFNALMWKNRKKSSSFYFRLLRMTPSFQSVMNGPKKTFFLRLIKWIIQKPFILLKRYLLDKDKFFKFYKDSLIKRMKSSEKLQSALSKYKFNYLIYPSTAYEAEWFDLTKLCKENDTKSFFLVDNWDNLSSKTTVLEKPDFVGVWGSQAEQHAIEIHGFTANQIFHLGTPRFNSYFKLRDSNLLSHFDFPYVLFLGTAINFDEEKILHILDEIIEKNKEAFKDLKILYRPHPWRQNLSLPKPHYGKNIITDPQALEGSLDKSTNYLPDLDYYPNLLQNCEYVIGGLTSMLIESLIFHKKVIALAVDDGVFLTNMKNNWKYFLHFKGLDNIDAVSIAHSFSDIEKIFLETWKTNQVLDKQIIDEQRNYILHNDKYEYAERLSRSIDIMNNG